MGRGSESGLVVASAPLSLIQVILGEGVSFQSAVSRTREGGGFLNPAVFSEPRTQIKFSFATPGVGSPKTLSRCTNSLEDCHLCLKLSDGPLGLPLLEPSLLPCPPQLRWSLKFWKGLQ